MAIARRDSAEVSRARYTVTGSPPADAVGAAAAVAPAGSSEVSMALQIASGKDHYHNQSPSLRVGVLAGRWCRASRNVSGNAP